MEDEIVPDTVTIIDKSAKAYLCSLCGWESFMFDWDSDDDLEEQRQEAVLHSKIPH